MWSWASKLCAKEGISSLHTYVKNIGSWRLFKPKPKSHMQQEIQKLCRIYWADVVRASCVKLSACMSCQPLVHLGCTCKTSWHEIQIGSSSRKVPWVNYLKSPAVTYWLIYKEYAGMNAVTLRLFNMARWRLHRTRAPDAFMTMHVWSGSVVDRCWANQYHIFPGRYAVWVAGVMHLA